MSNLKSLRVVWASSLLIVTTCLAALMANNSSGGFSSALFLRGAESEQFESDVIFIGSSLTGAGIPPSPLLDPVKPDQIAIRRWLPLISPAELEKELERALHSRPEFVFVELAAMTRPPQFARFPLRINAATAYSRESLKGFFTGTAVQHHMQREGQWLRGDFSKSSLGLRQEFENQLALADTERLQELVTSARSVGTEIIFVSFPRAVSASNLNLGVPYSEVRSSINELAAHLEQPLFAPSETWPDHYFSDSMHLNVRGRERYMEELRTWIGTR